MEYKNITKSFGISMQVPNGIKNSIIEIVIFISILSFIG